MLGKRDRLSIQDMLNAAIRAVRYASEVSEREFEIDEIARELLWRSGRR